MKKLIVLAMLAAFGAATIAPAFAQEPPAKTEKKAKKKKGGKKKKMEAPAAK